MEKILNKILKITLVIILFLFIAFIGWMYTSPSGIEVQEVKYIDVPASFAKDYISNFDNWEAWNKLPNREMGVVQMTETRKGKGAGYSWNSDDIGTGSIINEEETEDKLIQKYTFSRPMGITSCRIIWDFEGIVGKTKLTWTIEGEMPFFLRWTVKSIMKQLNKEIKIKLQHLKNQLEINYIQSLGIKITTVNKSPSIFFLYVNAQSSLEESAILYSNYFEKLATFGINNAVPLTGNPFVIYNDWSPEIQDVLTIKVCIPVKNLSKKINDGYFKYGQLSSSKSLKVVFNGAPEKIHKIHNILDSYIRQNSIEVKGDRIEFYNPVFSRKSTRDFEIIIYIPIY